MRFKNIHHLFSWKRLGALVALLSLLLFSNSGPIFAQTVTQGYMFEGFVQRGMIVALKADNPLEIELANFENGDRTHGVVVNQNDAPVTISDEESEQVFVATVGRYDLLVSDQNGPIQQGDYITVSALGGIGMRANEDYPVAVGKALSSFDGQTAVISTTDLVDNAGNPSRVRIGRIPVDIGIGPNPLSRPKSSNVPEFLQKAAEEVAGRPVSTVKIYIGVVIVSVAGAISGSLLYGGVRSSIISIGRNPLSKKSIIRGLVQIIITATLIFMIGIFGVYLILRL